MEYYLATCIVSLLLAIGFGVRRSKRKLKLPTIQFNEVLNLSEDLVLYLRSFSDDGMGPELPPSMHTVLPAFFGFKTLTYEEEILSFISNDFTVIAAGKPGEELPEFGALRLYLSEGEWRHKINQLLNRAKYIFVRPNNSESLEWEIRQIFFQGHHHKLIMSTKIGNVDDSAVRKAKYNDFAKKFQSLTGVHLPDLNKKTGFISFLEQGTPIAISKFSNLQKHLKKMHNFGNRII